MKRDYTQVRAKMEDAQCRACLCTGTLEAAHVVARSLGGGQSADSVIPLCPQCHRAQHAGKFELLPILTRDEEVEAVRVLGISRAYAYLTSETSGRVWTPHD